MKIFKRILLVLLILVLLIVIVGFMFPAKVHLERSIVMKASSENIFKEINSLKNFNSWSPFYELDTAAKYTYEGPEEGVGSKFTWESPKRDVGSGSMTIIESKPNESVVTSIQFKDQGEGSSTISLNPADGGTKMTWAFNMDAGLNPFERLMGGLMMDKMLGPMYEKGLNKLKNKIESYPSSSKEIKVEETTVQAMNYLAVRDTASKETISQKLGMDYKMIGDAMQKQKLNMAGPPFAIYYTDSKTSWELDAAIYTDKPGKADGKVKPGMIKPGNAVVAHYYGDYSNMSPAYDAIKKYIADHHKIKAGAPWEVYMTDPGMEKDTSKWQTDIYFPVE
jgi:effector-binding domain-containing protein